MADSPGTALKVKAVRAMVDVVARVGEDVLGRAQRDAPIAEGTLRASGELVLLVNGRRFEGAGARALAEETAVMLTRAGRAVECNAEISFSTVYAARQHEELGWKHPKGGRAKYLEANLVAQAARYRRIMDLALDRALS